MKIALTTSLWVALFSTTATAQAVPSAEAPRQPSLTDIVERAEALDQLETLIIARDGEILVEKGFRGHSTDAPTNIKSASKSIISALVGIAIDKGLIEGTDQKMTSLLNDRLPENADARIHDITIGNLLSMQAGLGRTSGANYGRWVSNSDWVRAALAQPFVGEPGGGMLYSTGNTHLLSAILTRVGRRSTLGLAREWLAPVRNFAIADWMRDPQGIYLGGNQMAMSPKSMLAFGELYRNGGKAGGQQVISQEWIEASWRPRTRSVFHDDQYGYGWFMADMAGHRVNYAWGHGGQMIYVVSSLDLTTIMTSAEGQGSARNGHRDNLHDLMRDIITVTKVETEGQG
ncbi:6-aminohexanoate hydrolase [Phyllobacterium phragmitis]|uniref:6-aminohexanoate hydrolase n=1 Tax=Phyllobacterium phragmitis TaxID=2670329 RepID=A0A2S9IR24_9HYPH|nr:serine hydrolase [Phyllobacterium phragmitis]PRD42977.1 6-aminohexanoate hydrolase [Phyllobacterium phragmitis]